MEADRTNSVTQQISEYVQAGFALFPITWISKLGKYIPVKGWNETTYDPDLEPNMLGDTFGVVLQHDDLVIDVDPRRFNGANNLVRLWKTLNLASPINTFIVKTPSGGNHIYLKKPSGIEVLRYMEKEYPGIEIKSKGQFVFGCGSIKTKGNVKGAYTVERGHVGRIADAEDSLVDFLEKPVVILTGEAKEVDAPEIVKRFEKYVTTCEIAVEGRGGNNQTYRVACVGRDFGLPEATVLNIMLELYNDRCRPPWEAHDLAVIVQNSFKYGKSEQGCRSTVEEDFADLELESGDTKMVSHKLPKIKFQTRADAANAKKNQLEPTLANALYMFLLKQWKDRANPLFELLRFNLFSEQIEFTRKAPWHVFPQKHWQDDDDVLLKFFFSDYMFFEAPTQLCREVAVAVSRQYQYHPVRQYLNGLKWDGVKRVDKLFTEYAGALDTPYHRACGKVALIGSIARVMEPGCKFDTLIIMEGEQGTGKSTFIKILGGDYYKEITLDMHRQHDTVAKMMNGWIIETPEMTFLKRAEADDLKFFLSTATDSVRFAYGRHMRSVPRQSIFIGTYNKEPGVGYLKDPTGNRRFLPIATRKINLDKLQEDRDQLFAEALYRYNQGEPWHFDTEDLIEAAKEEQAQREVKEPWALLIESALKDKDLMQVMPYLTVPVIATQILGLPSTKLDPYTTRRISTAMRELGYETRVRTVAGSSLRVYERSKSSYEYAGDL